MRTAGGQLQLGRVLIGLHRREQRERGAAERHGAEAWDRGLSALAVLLLLAQQDSQRLRSIHQLAGGLDVGAGLLTCWGSDEPASDATPADAVSAGGQADGGADRAAAQRVGIGDAGVAPGVVDTEEGLPLTSGEQAADGPFAGGEASAGVGFVVAKWLGDQLASAESAD